MLTPFGSASCAGRSVAPTVAFLLFTYAAVWPSVLAALSLRLPPLGARTVALRTMLLSLYTLLKCTLLGR